MFPPLRRCLALLIVLGTLAISVNARAGAQEPSPVEPATRLPRVQSVANANVMELESRIAELEAREAAREKAEAEKKKNKGTVVGSDLDMIPKWNHGLELQTKDKVFRTRLGGQLQADYTDFNQATQLGAMSSPTTYVPGAIGQQNESFNFRRLRLRSEGTMYENIGWVLLPEFANAANVSNVPGNPPGYPNNLHQGGSAAGPFPTGQTLALVPTLTDFYVTIMKMPYLGNFRIGNFKEPIGLEHMTSSRFLDFMERSYNQDLFYGPFNNGFMPGAMFFNWTENERATWQLWAGPNQSNFSGYHVGNGQFAGTMRGTILPYYDENSAGRYLQHFGGSLSVRKPDQGQDRFRARGDLRDGPPSILNTNYLDTGSFNSTFQYEFNAEYLTIWGPWTVQSEYFGTWLQGTAINPLNTSIPPSQIPLYAAASAGGTTFFQGGYLECLYFLTGESRGYDRRMGICDRIIPFENFWWVRDRNGCHCVGWGAWQVGARYSYTNLNSYLINGGMLNAMTLGINWFLTPNLKFQWNYDITYRSQVAETAPGWINAFGARVAFDF